MDMHSMYVVGELMMYSMINLIAVAVVSHPPKTCAITSDSASCLVRPRLRKDLSMSAFSALDEGLSRLDETALDAIPSIVSMPLVSVGFGQKGAIRV